MYKKTVIALFALMLPVSASALEISATLDGSGNPMLTQPVNTASGSGGYNYMRGAAACSSAGAFCTAGNDTAGMGMNGTSIITSFDGAVVSYEPTTTLTFRSFKIAGRVVGSGDIGAAFYLQDKTTHVVSFAGDGYVPAASVTPPHFGTGISFTNSEYDAMISTMSSSTLDIPIGSPVTVTSSQRLLVVISSSATSTPLIMITGGRLESINSSFGPESWNTGFQGGAVHVSGGNIDDTVDSPYHPYISSGYTQYYVPWLVLSDVDIGIPDSWHPGDPQHVGIGTSTASTTWETGSWTMPHDNDYYFPPFVSSTSTGIDGFYENVKNALALIPEWILGAVHYIADFVLARIGSHATALMSRRKPTA